MPKLYDVYFASSNSNKYREARAILAHFGIQLGYMRCKLTEIQSCSLQKIAHRKVQDAFERFKLPVLVEDAGLFIDGLGGFPGPFSSYVFHSIGNDGILRLLKRSRKAEFVSAVAFHSQFKSKIFLAKISGRIARIPRGVGWGFDPIFVPQGTSKTFAELSNKDTISHRFKALKKFSSWYTRTRKSCG